MPAQWSAPAAGIRRAAAKCAPCRIRQRCTDAEWTAYLFNRASVPGVKREWWCHTPSGYWFIAERDTARDEILATYDAAELPARAAP